MNLMISLSVEYLLLLSILLPAIAAIFPYLFSNLPKFRDIFQTLITIAVFLNIVLILNYYLNYGPIAIKLIKISNFEISFHTEPLSLIFALMASFLWIPTHIYSIGYVKAQNSKNNSEIGKDLVPGPFFGFMALSMAATFGIAFSANLFTLFIFYEMLTLATYPLITESKTSHAIKAGREYLGILIAPSLIFLLPAIITTYYYAGTLDFSVGGILLCKTTPLVTALLLAGYVFGISKTAIMPFHSWLPAAMVAPAPVSSLLHAVAVVKSGIFFLVKIIIYIFGLNNLNSLSNGNWWVRDWLVVLACFTILTSALLASRQKSVKKILAYSTISQLSYCMLGIGIMSVKSITAAIMHMLTHAITKITLFFAAGVIYTSTRKTEIDQFFGLAKYMPYSMLSFTIASLSIIGIPPAACFISKFLLFQAGWESDYYLLVSFTIIAGSTLSASYFLPIIFRAYFGKNINEVKPIIYKKPSYKTLGPLLLTSSMIIIFFIYFDTIKDFMNKIIIN